MSKKKEQPVEPVAAETEDQVTEQASPETPPVAEAPVEPSLEEQLATARAETQKNWDLYLRERADLENFRRRAQREKEDLARFANENILKELLPVIDNLERALDHARQESGNDDGLRQGVEMTLNLLVKSLDKFGVSPIQSVGESFDPARHEAMGQVENADQPANTVLHEMQKGYLLNGRLLRPALVMLAKAPAQQA